MANEAAWAARLARYKGPELKRSVWQLASAAALFGGAWVLMYASLRVGYWLTLLLAVPAAFFLIRLFIIQHDCGHAAFFRISVMRCSPPPPAFIIAGSVRDNIARSFAPSHSSRQRNRGESSQ